MSDPLSQSSDTFTTNMQEHDKDAFGIKTTERVVGIVKSEPPSAPQDKPMESGSEPFLAPSKSNTMPQKVPETGPPPFSPKNANVGSSFETSTVLQGYEELQCVLNELDDEDQGLRRQIIKDAEAHLEPKDYCLFEQLFPLWTQIPKIRRNVGFQTLGYKGDSNRVYEILQNERIEIIKALDKLSRDTHGRGAERRPRATGMDKEIHEILAKLVKVRPDWEAIHLD
ncbi:hypothetical protein P9112_002818 [Eukaryota sp. TZLM1-RC]